MGNEKMCNKGFEKTVLKGNISYTSYTCSIRKEAWLKVNRHDVLQFYPFTSCTAILISASKNPRSSLLLLILSLQQN
jgi:hypothetical protein